MSCSCKHQEILYRGVVSLKESNLGKIKSHSFSDYQIIAISKEFLHVNNEKPLIFEAKLTKDGKLELCANLSKLSHSSKEVSTNGSSIRT